MNLLITLALPALIAGTTFELDGDTTATSAPDLEETELVLQQAPEDTLEKVCLTLTGHYGRNFNMIIEIAHLLEDAAQLTGERVQLMGKWARFYEAWFEPNPNIDLKLHSNDNLKGVIAGKDFGCELVTARQMFYLYSDTKDTVNPWVAEMHLKQSIQDAAIQAVQEIGPHFVSVHRRWLEGTCPKRILSHGWARCEHMSDDELETICTWTESDIRSALHAEGIRGASTWPIVLFTDSQQPEEDNTFSHIDRHDFNVAIAMMTMSDVHFGNPASSVDHILSIWRTKGRMLPSHCWEN